MKTIEIEVTQRDIDKGLPCAPCDCPLSLAMRRKLRRQVVVFTVHARLGRKRWMLPLPESARVFRLRFDQGLTVEPFTFSIEVPE